VTSSCRRFPSAVAESNRCEALESRSLGKTYRALIKRSMSPSGGTFLHLIRYNAEASLCGIPRAQLGAAGGFDELVYGECIEWLPKRIDFSAAHQRVERD
jgi:hypothetical protein